MSKKENRDWRRKEGAQEKNSTAKAGAKGEVIDGGRAPK